MQLPLLFSLCVFFFPFLRAFDTAHFYRAPFLFREPWLEKSWMSGFFINEGYGETHKSKNSCGNTVPLLDLYGPSNVQDAILGISQPSDDTLTALAALPSDGTFAHLSLQGKFHAMEIVIEWYQNFLRGIFLHFHMPVRRLKISPVNFLDLSPTSGAGPLQENPLWQNFLIQQDQILNQFNLVRKGYVRQGIGDPGIALGWTLNYEETSHLDFIDATIQCGATIPASKRTGIYHLLELPLGYNGHTSIFIQADTAIGLYDWLTFSLTATGMAFTPHVSLQRVKTNEQQQGLIVLETQTVRIHKGPIAIAGILLKADHFLRGFSLDLAYQFNYQGKDRWTLCTSGQPYPFTDARLLGWNMHTINLQATYDLSTPNHPCAPTLGFVCNLPVAGQRIITTPLFGAQISFMAGGSW